SRPELTVDFAAPRNEIERTVAGMWGRLLGIDSVGINDDFFDLGGHSLLGLQLVARLQETFGVNVPLRTLFDRRTVADLAAAIVEAQVEQADSAVLAELLAELGELSEEEAAAMLAGEALDSAGGT